MTDDKTQTQIDIEKFRELNGKIVDENKKLQERILYLEALRTPQWQPIETAPKDDDEDVLLTNGKTIFIALYDIEGECWCMHHMTEKGYTYKMRPSYNATHWMPLPQPPEEEHG